MNSSAITFDQGAYVSTVPTWHQQLLGQPNGIAEHAPLLFHSMPTETIQPCAVQGATDVPNRQVHDYELAMECQKVPSVYATSNEEKCLAKSEQPHPGTETQIILDRLAHIQSKLQTISENLSQDLKRMKSWESKQPAAIQPNPSTQEAINVSDEMPLYAVYAKEDSDCSIGFCSVLGTCLVNQQDGEGEPDTEHTSKYFSKASGNASSEQLLKRFSKAPETEYTSACLNYISEVFDYTLEQQHDDEKASANGHQLRDPQWHVLGTPERINEWDPGDHTVLSSTQNKDIMGVPTCVPQQSYCKVPSSQENHGTQFLWDPGILSWSVFSAQHILDFSIKRGSTFSAGHSLSQDSWYATFLLQQNFWEFSMEQGAQMPWDPGQAPIVMKSEQVETPWRTVFSEMYLCYNF